MTIFGVYDDGITEVNIQEKRDVLIIATAIKEVLTNIPEIMAAVTIMMETDDTGIIAEKFEGEDITLKKVRGIIKGRQKANKEDLPDFVKRSLNEDQSGL